MADKEKAQKPPSARTLKKWLAEHLQHRETGREHYAAGDALLEKLIRFLPLGSRLRHPETGEEYEVTSPFTKDGVAKNKAVGISFVKMFEITPVKGSKKPGG